jgi:hypothetical protein
MRGRLPRRLRSLVASRRILIVCGGLAYLATTALGGLVPGNLREPHLEQIRWELQALIAQSELRMTKWMFITAAPLLAIISKGMSD